MFQCNVIGIDTAKSSFEIFEWKDEKVQMQRSLPRKKFAEFFQKMEKKTLIMEACGGSHYWGRLFTKMGHNVKLIAPQKVTPFRMAHKNDKNDARAVALAGVCPNMKFVPIKESWQQDILSIHRIRERLMGNQTSLINEIRGLLQEYGIVIPVRANNLRSHLADPATLADQNISPLMRRQVVALHDELLQITTRIEQCDKDLESFHKESDASQRIAKIEGIGLITATAIAASCPNPDVFKNGREFSCWLGLVPGHTQTGGKDSKPKMLGITKKGDKYLRKLLVQGSMATIATMNKAIRIKTAAEELKQTTKTDIPTMPRIATTSVANHPGRKRKKFVSRAKDKSQSRLEWLHRLVKEKGTQKAAVALANRNARVIWALLKTKQSYDPKRGGGISHAA
jgi:transposase